MTKKDFQRHFPTPSR